MQASFNSFDKVSSINRLSTVKHNLIKKKKKNLMKKALSDLFSDNQTFTFDDPPYLFIHETT